MNEKLMKEDNKINRLDQLFREQENGFDRKPSGHAWSRLEHLLDNQEELSKENEAERKLKNQKEENKSDQENVKQESKSKSISWKKYLVAASMIFALAVFGMYLPSILQNNTKENLATKTAVKTPSNSQKPSAKKSFRSIDENADLKTVFKDTVKPVTATQLEVSDEVTFAIELNNQGSEEDQDIEISNDMAQFADRTFDSVQDSGHGLDDYLEDGDKELAEKLASGDQTDGRDGSNSFFNNESTGENAPIAVLDREVAEIEDEAEVYYQEEADFAASEIPGDLPPAAPAGGLGWTADTLSYSLHITNQGPSDATGVRDEAVFDQYLDKDDQNLVQEMIEEAESEEEVIIDGGTVAPTSMERAAETQDGNSVMNLETLAGVESSRREARKAKKAAKALEKEQREDSDIVFEYKSEEAEEEKTESDSAGFDKLDYGSATVMSNAIVTLAPNITWIVGEWETNDGSLSIKQETTTKIVVEIFDTSGDLLETWTIDEDVGQMELKRKMRYSNAAYTVSKLVPGDYLLIESNSGKLYFQDTTTGSQGSIKFSMDGINAMTILDSPPQKGPPRKIQATRK